MTDDPATTRRVRRLWASLPVGHPDAVHAVAAWLNLDPATVAGIVHPIGAVDDRVARDTPAAGEVAR